MKRTSEELLEFFGLKPFDMISIKKKNEFGEYEWSEWFELSDDWSSSNLVASILNMDYKFFRQQRKQIPLKPRYTIIYDEENRWISANCGLCDEYLPTTHPYCNGCGQRIDWTNQPDLTLDNALKYKPQLTDDEKGTPQLTDDEKVILRNLPKELWIAKDEDNALYAHYEKPERFEGELYRCWISAESVYVPFSNLFTSIKWEDEPYEIKELLK